MNPSLLFYAFADARRHCDRGYTGEIYELDLVCVLGEDADITVTSAADDKIAAEQA